MHQSCSYPSHPTRVRLADLVALRPHALGLGRAIGRTQRGVAGHDRSRRPGEGMDFETSRVYQPGDDIRRVDWRVTARRGTPYTKVHNAEHGRRVILVVDLGASMAFATHGAFKRVVAAQTAALLAWLGAERGDRIGGVVATADGRVTELRPGAGSPAVLALLRVLSGVTVPDHPAEGHGRGTADLAGAVRRAGRLADAGGLVFVLSDFRSLEPDSAARLARTLRRADTVLGYVHDAAEIDLPGTGRFRFTDGREAFELTAGEDGHAAFRHRARRHRCAIAALAPARRIIELPTASSVIEVLGESAVIAGVLSAPANPDPARRHGR